MNTEERGAVSIAISKGFEPWFPFARRYRRPMKLAVVIPVLDEAERIEVVVARALEPRDLPPGDAELELEVLVVDGGSQDATRALAERAGANVISVASGRARQLQAGVEATRAEVVLFLHADTLLDPQYSQAIEAVLQEEAVIGGAFRFALDASGFSMRFVEWGTRLRNWVTECPYGDQAIFVRRAVLDEIGGIPQVPVLEDIDLIQAMKRRGRIVILSLPAVSSARRYQTHGVWRMAIRNRLMVLARLAGIDRERLAAWYRR